MMAYLVRSMESGGLLGRALMNQMVDNAVGYLEDGVRAGAIKPSRDPKARARFLALNNGGGSSFIGTCTQRRRTWPQCCGISAET